MSDAPLLRNVDLRGMLRSTKEFRRLSVPGAGSMVTAPLVLPGECSGCSSVDCKHHGPYNRKRARRAARAR